MKHSSSVPLWQAAMGLTAKIMCFEIPGKIMSFIYYKVYEWCLNLVKHVTFICDG